MQTKEEKTKRVNIPSLLIRQLGRRKWRTRELMVGLTELNVPSNVQFFKRELPRRQMYGVNQASSVVRLGLATPSG